MKWHRYVCMSQGMTVGVQAGHIGVELGSWKLLIRYTVLVCEVLFMV